MAERGGEGRGGFGRGFGRGDRGGRGRGDRGGRGRGRRDAKPEDRWTPCTKLGRLVKKSVLSMTSTVYHQQILLLHFLSHCFFYHLLESLHCLAFGASFR